MHERFGRVWEERWQKLSNGGLFPYPEEYYFLARKESYEESRRWKGTLAHWEHDGFGYTVSMQHNTGQGEWHLPRTDLTDYCCISYRFWSKEQIDARIEREIWRPYEQITLGI